MISAMKRYMQVVVIGGFVVGSVALSAAGSADEGQVSFKVGATDLAAGGIPTPEYPASGGATTDPYDGIGETDRAAGIVGIGVDRLGLVIALETEDEVRYAEQTLGRGREALTALDKQVTIHCPAETEDEVRYAEQTLGRGREALTALDKIVIAARLGLAAKAGFTDMSAGGLPEPDEFRGGSRVVYTGIGETDRAAGIIGFGVDRNGLVIALESLDASSFVLLRTELNANGRHTS